MLQSDTDTEYKIMGELNMNKITIDKMKLRLKKNQEIIKDYFDNEDTFIYEDWMFFLLKETNNLMEILDTQTEDLKWRTN
jgi:hypothetical protein